MSKNQVLAFPSAEADGMTLRDYFASKALQGIIAKYGNQPPYLCENEEESDEFARWAYEIADFMMDWRKE
jgi:hypothetical protein